MQKTLNKIPVIKFDPCKIASSMNDVFEYVKAGKWVYFYDNELDQVYLTPQKGVSKKFSLISVEQGWSLYVSKDSKIGGVMINYYRTNHASSDEDFKEYKDVFTKSVSGGKTIPKSEKDKMENLTLRVMHEIEKSLKAMSVNTARPCQFS